MRPQDCWDPAYRYGSCCNQTLVNIGLSLLSSITPDKDIGNVTLTTDLGLEMTVSKQRTDWGIRLYPNDVTRGRNYTPSLFVTNFTEGTPWLLAVPIRVDATPQPIPGKWPCKTSAYLPHDDKVCDIMFNGYQSVAGEPTVPLGINTVGLPNCCPEGIVRLARDDSCCVDNLAENPYRLSFNGSGPVAPPVGATTSADTVFTFQVAYKGSTDINMPGVSNGTRANCSVSEVDQVMLFVAPSALDAVYKVIVDGKVVDFTRSSNSYQSWIRAINLYKVNSAPSIMSVYVAANLTAEELCPTRMSGSPLCEYVLKGAYDDAAHEFMCCPYGVAPSAGPECPV